MLVWNSMADVSDAIDELMTMRLRCHALMRAPGRHLRLRGHPSQAQLQEDGLRQSY
jgi:hypothetical protein